MGRKPLKHVEGPVTVPAAGNHIFWFTFPEKTDPYMIDLVAAQLVTGTGAMCRLWLIQGTQYMRLTSAFLTVDSPSMVYNQHFLMSVGDRLKVIFTGLTATDEVEWTVRGH
jgi:hypothetical protein